MKPGRRGSRTIGMDMRSGLAIGLVLAASLGHAQQKKRTTQPPPAPAPQQQEQSAYPLETLKIQGNQRISSEKIIAASGLKIGATVEKADFDKARARLLAGGAFESV